MLGKNYYAVIMAGGVGSRFWPYSRNLYPKQFLDVLGTGKSLLQMTYDRLLKQFDSENIIIISHVDYTNLVQEQIPNIASHNLISEPLRKNTAPCTALATQIILQRNPEAYILTAPADHLILQEDEFKKDIEECFKFLLKQDVLMTLGIQASRPDTGYGYIHLNEQFHYENEIYKVNRFVEKPNHNTALKYLQAGDYVWNSGMFLWKAANIWGEIEKSSILLAQTFRNFKIENIDACYHECESISIDYAVMEKADRVCVKKVDFGWSDLGTWGSIYTLLPQDTQENAIVSKTELLYEVERCIIHNQTDQIMVIQGLEDYIVVNTKDALLICQKSEEQRIKKILSDVENKFGRSYI